MKVQNFRKSLTAQLKFYRICTLLAPYVESSKISYQKYRGVMSHNPEDWCKFWKKDKLLFQKWQEFGEFLSEHSQVTKIWILISSSRPNDLTFNLKNNNNKKKNNRGVIFHDTEESYKIWRKTGCLRNDIRNLANSHQSIRNLKNYLFHELLLTKE